MISLTSQPGKAERRTVVAACGARTADPCRTQKPLSSPPCNVQSELKDGLNSAKHSNFCLSARMEGKTQISLNGFAELKPLAREVSAAQGFVSGSRSQGSDTAELGQELENGATSAANSAWERGRPQEPRECSEDGKGWKMQLLPQQAPSAGKSGQRRDKSPGCLKHHPGVPPLPGSQGGLWLLLPSRGSKPGRGSRSAPVPPWGHEHCVPGAQSQLTQPTSSFSICQHKLSPLQTNTTFLASDQKLGPGTMEMGGRFSSS